MEHVHNINDYDYLLTEAQERMRRDLRYHFMNPKEKWQAKGTLPIKMILIVIKIILITVQVIVFSENNSNQVTFIEGSKTTFKHLFLKGWDAGFETLPYPPTSGQFAVYTIDQFYDTVNFALKHYYSLESEAVGPYSFADNDKPRMTLCVSHYKVSTITPSNSTYNFSTEIVQACIDIVPIQRNGTDEFNILAYLRSQNFTVNFHGLIKANIQFSLRSVQLKSFEIDELPDCFQFNLVILFDNSFHNGQVLVDLHTGIVELQCKSKPNIEISNGILIKNSLFALDTFVLLLSSFSLFLCVRSISRLCSFWKKTKRFFLEEMGVDISNKRNYFWSISYFLIFIGDVFILSGTVIKMQMFTEMQKVMAHFTICTYFLGLGLFFGYLTLLRYFSYFPKSSILVNTIRVAVPPLFRFSLCSVILYLAFAILGWVILGPYHLKFRTFESSIACLFSLMMGDDMYVTLSIINKENMHVYLFSQLYVYFFLVLFIFVVLNLILTIIIEAYDNVKNHDTNAQQLDSFWTFINSCPETSKSPLYRSDKILERSQSAQRHTRLARKFVDIFCCCIGHESHQTEILNIQDTDSVVDDLATSFTRTESQHRLYSVVNSDYRSLCVTNRFAAVEPPTVPVESPRLPRMSV